MNNRIDPPVDVFMHSSAIFAEALREDSNRELEWLWYASQMRTRAEREYCLKRALYINPNNRQTQRALRKIKQSVTGCKRKPAWRVVLGRVGFPGILRMTRSGD